MKPSTIGSVVPRVLEWAGIPSTPGLLASLERYRTWLTQEATVAGGIGPDEGPRLDARHLADSLLFAGVWEREATRPVLDVGSGVGLPGLPLALAVPHRHFILIDRSGRRVQLLRRAVRVLQVENVEVRQADVVGFEWTENTVVARASLPPADLLALIRRQGRPRELLVGGSHRTRPAVPGFETVEIPPEILAWRAWILRMGK